MNWIPPQNTLYALKEGQGGTAPWALQRALNSTALFPALVEDAQFGPRTASTVRAFQDLRKLAADAVAGPRTQQHLAQKLISKANQDLPGGLMLSIVEGESGALIAAVNWSVAGGVDVGYTQRRVLGPPFDDGAVQRAFDSLYQFRLVRAQLLEREVSLRTKPAVHSTRRAWELATLWHNWPSGSDRLSKTEERNLSDYWTTSQPWVVAIGARFADGRHVNTPLDWSRFYIARMTKHVDWD